MSVRLDKWLQVARAFKTRSAATRACVLGRVEVNGQRAKPHRSLAVGDRVSVERGDWRQVWVVRELAERPLPRSEVGRLYEDLSPPRPALDPLQRLLRRPPAERDRGRGRPSKKERRQLERWRS